MSASAARMTCRSRCSSSMRELTNTRRRWWRIASRSDPAALVLRHPEMRQTKVVGAHIVVEPGDVDLPVD
jgi:hypothetical protein